MYNIVFASAAYFVNKINKINLIEDDKYPTLSIVICAHNEFDNLQKYLSNILNIDYPKALLEVIIVNDTSSDDSQLYLDEISKAYNYVKIITINEDTVKDLPGKKYALKQGIKASNGKFILLTDADCYTASPLWAKKMVSAIIYKKADVIIGYGAYHYQYKNLLQDFIQFETLHTAMQYMSYAVFKKSYMGVGRNILYKSSLIKPATDNEFLINTLNETVSGDDDLIISYFSQKGVKIVAYADKESHTYSDSKTNINDYIIQKSRHTSSSKFYSITNQLLLGLYALAHFTTWILLPTMLIVYFFTNSNNIIIWSVLLLTISNAITFYIWKKILNNPINIFKLLYLDGIWAIYNLILSPYIFWKNKYQWK